MTRPAQSDRDFLLQAVELARSTMRQGFGGPFGALVVKDGVVIAEGFNQVTSANDPTAHAEITAIREACRRLETFDLGGCVLYSSCEPCPMCLAAIYWARLDRLVYASTRDDAAAIGFDDSLIYEQIARPVAERSLPTERLPLEEADRLMREWYAWDQKVPY